MDDRRRGLAWPILGLCLTLLVVCLAAPRVWKLWQSDDKTAERGKAAASTRRHAPNLPAPEKAAPLVSAPGLKVPTAIEVLPENLVAEVVTEVASPDVTSESTATVDQRAAITVIEPELASPQSADIPGEPATLPVEHDIDHGPLADVSHIKLVTPEIQPPPRPAAESAERPEAPTPGSVLEPPAERVALAPSVGSLPRRDSPGKSGDAPRPSESLVPRSPTARAKSTNVWCQPKALLDALEGLATHSAAAPWAREAISQIHDVGAAMQSGSSRAAQLIDKLRQHAADGSARAGKLDDKLVARRMRQAAYSLDGRIELWAMLAEKRDVPVDAAMPLREREPLSVCVAELDALTRKDKAGPGWREYLLLDELRKAAQREDAQAIPPELAREVLRRLAKVPMTAEQRKFVASKPVAALTTELRRATAEPFDPALLLKHIEAFEQSRMPSDARRVAADLLAASLSASDSDRALGRRGEPHWRNANVRIAITEALMNRVMPKPAPEVAAVSDQMLGVPVRGQSRNVSDVKVKLIPDPNRVRLALEVNGSVQSYTSSSSGPATFYTNGSAYYFARKPLEIDLEGVHLQQSDVDVLGDTRLQKLETDFDRIWILGPLVKNIAKQKIDEQKPNINREMRRKVASKAKQRLDHEAGEKLSDATRKLQQQVLNPLHRLSLDPTMIAAETNTERFSMRLRVAGDDQLGAFTPRPQAPSDSLASVQLHESVLNNALQRLELDGRGFTLMELARQVQSRLGKISSLEPEPEHEDVTITFADKDAIFVRLQDGQLVVHLHVARLTKAQRVWRDFQVKAFFKPRIDGRNAELVRDGVVHLLGQRLNTGSQIALRGIFGKVFPRNQVLPLTPQSLVENQKLSDMAITQLMIDDGWLGVALGPKRATTASRGGTVR